MSSAPMSMIVVTREFPYPPVHGGLLDTWNRIVALARRGVRLHLICWADKPVAEKCLNPVRACVASVQVHLRNRSLLGALHPRYPTGMISRTLPRSEHVAELERVKHVSPDIVFLDGLEGAGLATFLAAELNLPLVYRSHNVEYQYMKDMFRAARPSVRKAVLLSNAWRTQRIEREVRTSSSAVYDISTQDRDAWRDVAGAGGTKVLNYYLLNAELVADNDNPADIDLLYVGNLRAPNNVFGLEWFVEEVAPLLGDLRVTVAGSTPTPKICEVVRGAGIELVPNPKDVQRLYGRSRVLINPVWHGSGLNIKMVEFLATGLPVVSTVAGTRGLDESVLRFVKVANEPEAFVRAVREGLARGFSLEQRRTVSARYGWENVDYLISDLREICRNREPRAR